MEELMRVLDTRSRELAAHIAERQDFSAEAADRFVDLAGTELRESWRWQASALQADDLPTWSNVQRLLGSVHADAIASTMDIAPEEVWRALRTFVPRVLLLASRSSVDTRRGRHGSHPGPSGVGRPERMEAAS